VFFPDSLEWHGLILHVAAPSRFRRIVARVRRVLRRRPPEVAGRSTHIESIQSITMEPNLSQLYQRRLKSKHPHLGEALWVPQTNRSLPTPYRQSGIRIGDVGLVNREGGFDFLFNICLPHDDLINDGRVSDNFEPLTPAFDPRFDIMDFPAYHGSGTCLTSKRIEHSRDNGWVVSFTSL